MFQYADFQTEGEPTPFDAESLLKKTLATLVDQMEYDAAGIAERLSIRTLEAARLVSAFSVGNGAGNPIHFVKSQRGSLNGSRWRFSIRPIDDKLAVRQESRLAA